MKLTQSDSKNDQADNLYREAQEAFSRGDSKECLLLLRKLTKDFLTSDHPLYDKTVVLAVAATLDAAQEQGLMTNKDADQLLGA